MPPLRALAPCWRRGPWVRVRLPRSAKGFKRRLLTLVKSKEDPAIRSPGLRLARSGAHGAVSLAPLRACCGLRVLIARVDRRAISFAALLPYS